MIRLTILAAAALPLAGAAYAAERPGRPPLRPENLPEGVRLPPQPGCAADAPVRRPRREGGSEVGQGTSLRIGGRVGTEFGARR